MSERLGLCPAQPFFLPAQYGKRFCLYHPPHPATEVHSAVIYIHPFAEEMNRARRLAAQQARMLCARGVGVLLIDLFGCGDSSGEFAEARWEIWKDDLARAQQWLEQHVGVPVSLWGLRLGGLLALDFARSTQGNLHQILLWQPVMRGELFLTQFLRLHLAGDLFASGTQKNANTHALRATLKDGQILEIAGYEISPALAATIDSLDAATCAIQHIPIHWFEIVAAENRAVPPAAMQTFSALKQQGMDVHMHKVTGAPFWAMQESAECPDLLRATVQIFNPIAR